MSVTTEDQINPTVAPARLKEIDVLRGLAAIWVVLSHYQPHWALYLGPTFVLVPNLAGRYAVLLFFVISGFVIFMTLDRCKTVLDFAVLRFSRLYPAYWAALGISTVISIVLFGSTLWPGGVLTNATMFQEFFGFPNTDVVFWSLTVRFSICWSSAISSSSTWSRPAVSRMIVSRPWRLASARASWQTLTGFDAGLAEDRAR